LQSPSVVLGRSGDEKQDQQDQDDRSDTDVHVVPPVQVSFVLYETTYTRREETGNDVQSSSSAKHGELDPEPIRGPIPAMFVGEDREDHLRDLVGARLATNGLDYQAQPIV
jgi:hypothetical protein